MKKEQFRSVVKECVKTVLLEYVDFQTQISNAIRQARKQKDAEKLLYYRQAFNKSAVAGWDQFKGSWAYGEWKRKNQPEIDKVNQEFKRFSYMGEGDEDGTSYGKRDGEFGQEYSDPPAQGLDKDKMKKINDILVVCEYGMKKLNDPKYIDASLSQIQKICIELLKMHGAK